jgi:hypothetical protein
MQFTPNHSINPAFALRRVGDFARRHWAAVLFLFGALFYSQFAISAGTTGTALQPAFDALNDLVGGYGKQLLVLVGFVAAAFAVMAANAASAVLKFIGYVIFLAVGLTAALTLSGAVI